MADHTRPDRARSIGPAIDPPADPPEVPCLDTVRRDTAQLLREGEQILGAVRSWAEAIRSAVDDYEHHVRPHHLADDSHETLSTEVGVALLYELLEAVATACTDVT